MEDYSRELEKELKTHARPASVKKKIRAEFYRIDEFGKMTCVSWIRPLMFFLTLLVIGLTLTASSLVYLFVQGAGARTELVQKLDLHDQTIQKLARDKEILMAQLVLSGNTPDLEPMDEPGSALSEQDILLPFGAQNSEEIAKDSEPVNPQGEKSEEKLPVKSTEKSITSPSAPVESIPNDGPSEVSLKDVPPPVEILGIEQIRIMNDERNGDLLFRFDIKNISDDLDTISGYVFVVLKPVSSSASDWLVLPSAPIDKGKPAQFKRGQYFSISRFKPVNFRVKSSLSPGDFKLATIFVYGEDGSLIAMHDVKIEHKEA